MLRKENGLEAVWSEKEWNKNVYGNNEADVSDLEEKLGKMKISALGRIEDKHKDRERANHRNPLKMRKIERFSWNTQTEGLC